MESHAFDEQIVVTGAGPADLIAAVWFGLEYRPADSLVLAGLHGPRRRLGVILHCDLADPRVPFSSIAPPSGVLREVLDDVRRAGASSVVALLFAPSALDVPGRRLAARVRAEARLVDVPLFDVIGVTPTHFRSMLCRDETCCPVSGRPISEVVSSRVAAGQVYRGGPMIPEGWRGEREEEWEGDWGQGWFEPYADPVADPADWYRRWRGATESDDPVGGVAAVPGLGGALHDGRLRDAVLLSLIGSGEADEMPSDTSVFTSFEALFAAPPDPARLKRGEAALAEVVRLARPGERGPALAVLAMAAWFDGRAVRARLLAGRARADVPGLRLAGLVEELLARRITPPWAGEPVNP